MARELLVRFTGESKDFNKTVDTVEKKTKSLGESAAKSGKRMGDGIDAGAKKGAGGAGKLSGAIGLATKAFAPLMAAAAAFQAVDWAAGSVDAARESQKVAATTAQIIKATGGAAKISADQVAELAGAISAKTGMDDEAIQSSANLLLTFKNVRNEVGAGADIFNRATAAAQDMSAAGFGDAEGAAKMLGKALNDPLKGITALGRAGVTFTDQQKKQIEKLVETGDILGAQKMIMKEVESQVGGVAEAQATAADKAKVAWGNLQEELGGVLLPVVEDLQQFMVDKLIPALSDAVKWLDTNLGPAATGAAENVGKVTDGAKALFDLLVGGDFTGKFSEIFGIEEDDNIVGTLFDMRTNAQELFKVISDGVAGLKAPDFDKIFNSDSAKEARDTWAETFATFSAPDENGGFTQWVKDDLMPALQSLSETFDEAWQKVQPIVDEISAEMAAFLTEHEPEISEAADKIGEIVTRLVELIDTTIGTFADTTAQVWEDWGWLIMDVAKFGFEQLGIIISGALDVVSGIIKAVTSLISGDWEGAWEGITQIFSGVWDTLTGLAENGTRMITDTAEKMGFTKAMGDALQWVKDKWAAVTDWLMRPVNAAKDGVSSAVTGIGDQFARIREMAASPFRFVINTVFNGGIRAAFNQLAETFGSSTRIPELAAGFADGGWTGPGSKYQPAGIVHADEFVISKGSRQMFEARYPGYLKHINDTGTMPGYAGGGWVKPVNASSSGWNGGRYSSGKWHGGLDYPVPTGTPIVSPGAGIVAAKRALETSYGHHYILQMVNGYRVILAHLSKLNALPTVGMPVLPGMELGLSGSTGNSTGPHLHFEVIPPGGSHASAVDPSGMVGEFSRIPGISDVAGMIKDAFAGALDDLGGLGDHPLGQLAQRIPRTAVDLAGDALKGMLVRDRGGPLPTGPSLVYNGTGRAEQVLTGEQMDRLLAALERRSMNVTVTPDPRGFRDVVVAVLDELGVDAPGAGVTVGGAA